MSILSDAGVHTAHDYEYQMSFPSNTPLPHLAASYHTPQVNISLYNTSLLHVIHHRLIFPFSTPLLHLGASYHTPKVKFPLPHLADSSYTP